LFEKPLHFVIGFGVSRRSRERQSDSMHEQHDSDFLPWVLTVAAMLIMATAVSMGAGEPRPPQPQLKATEPAPERAAGRI
jgi:hypothetical protein